MFQVGRLFSRVNRNRSPGWVGASGIRYSTAWYHPTKLGEYHIYCDQYCGTWHSLMVGKVSVVTQDEYTHDVIVPWSERLVLVFDAT